MQNLLFATSVPNVITVTTAPSAVAASFQGCNGGIDEGGDGDGDDDVVKPDSCKCCYCSLKMLPEFCHWIGDDTVAQG